MERRYIKTTRFTILAVLFCLICAVFIVRLANFQISSREAYLPIDEEETTVRYVSIEAVRGEICDRNGEVLVSNDYSYSLVLDYSQLPDTYAEINSVLLTVNKAIEITDSQGNRVADSFPFDGVYPSLTYRDEIADESSALYASFEKVLTENFKKSSNTIDEIKAEYTAEALVEYYTEKCNLVDKKGNPLYTNEEITELIRYYYEFNLKKFSYYGTYTVVNDVNLALITYISEKRATGATLVLESNRVYNYPGYASHILGRLGKIYAEDWEYYSELGYPMDASVGVDGCEAAFEQILRGVDGTLAIVEDEDGNVVSTYVDQEPVAGKDVLLTIDINIQIAAEDALAKNIEMVKANAYGGLTGEDVSAGSVIAQDPNTGEILAIASYPTFDLSTFSEDYSELLTADANPLFNRALSGLYTPGSTFKIGIAIAALSENVIEPYTIIHALDKYYVSDDYSLGEHGGVGFGDINISDAISVSSNYFFCTLGERLGIAKMNEYCKIYGFGLPTGVELPESIGILAGEEYRSEHGLGSWTLGNTVQAAIGQSDNQFNPVQINNYMVMVANGGTRYAAHLLYATRDYATGSLTLQSPQVLSTIEIADDNYAAILEGMREVITTSGNPYIMQYLKNYKYSVAAKTGTAQVSTVMSDNALLCAFAPYDNPQIVVTSIMEQGYTGGNNGYTISKVFDAYFKSVANQPVG